MPANLAESSHGEEEAEQGAQDTGRQYSFATSFREDKNVIEWEIYFYVQGYKFGVSINAMDSYMAYAYNESIRLSRDIGINNAINYFVSLILSTLEFIYISNKVSIIGVMLSERLRLINKYAKDYPGEPISDYIMKIIPELKKLRDGDFLGTDIKGSESVSVALEIVELKENSNVSIPKKAPDLYKEHVNKSEIAPKWGKRDKQKYKGYHSIFQFIADYHSDVRTTGGLNARDHSLYQAYRTAMERRQELIAGGGTPELFPEGFKPLLDKDTEIKTYAPPPKEDLQAARALLARDRRGRKRTESQGR